MDESAPPGKTQLLGPCGCSQAICKCARNVDVQGSDSSVPKPRKGACGLPCTHNCAISGRASGACIGCAWNLISPHSTPIKDVIDGCRQHLTQLEPKQCEANRLMNRRQQQCKQHRRSWGYCSSLWPQQPQQPPEADSRAAARSSCPVRARIRRGSEKVRLQRHGASAHADLEPDATTSQSARDSSPSGCAAR